MSQIKDALSEAGALDGLHVKLWRGKRMVLIGMDVDAPEADLVGFSIEVQNPSATGFTALRNRLAFLYDEAVGQGVTGFRLYDSTQSPFQKFRWLHFPQNPQPGTYQYRVTKQHMHPDSTLYAGTSLTVCISLEEVVYEGFLDLGFTRGYASSQAFTDRYGADPKILPPNAATSLTFKKVPGDAYQWLGFEAYDLLFNLLDEIANNPALTVDCFAYDFNEPDILAKLVAAGSRVRAILDDSGDHLPPNSPESVVAAQLAVSAGAANVKRMHFLRLQHNKVLIVKKAGMPYKVLFGSTNFSWRGLYIQANNTVILSAPEPVQLFADYFEQVFTQPTGYPDTFLSSTWHSFNAPGKPGLSLCLAPHQDAALSLGPIGQAITDATSSVFFAIAFLNLDKDGAVRQAIDALENEPLFSYGISDSTSGLTIHKPDGSVGIVDFAYLAQHAPEPFKAEWSGGAGIHEHNKFVVVDFNLPTAKVFTGSSNFAVGGEQENGDNLILIEDSRVATLYALEALRIFDHLEFRSAMKAAGAPDILTLKKPTALSGQPAWFTRFYVPGSQAARDRQLFSR